MKRRLTARQRMFLRTPNANVLISFRVTGILSKEQIDDAVTKLRDIHPLTKVRIHVDDQNRAWFVDDGVAKDYEITEHRPESDSSWKQVVIDELQVRHRIESGPLVRIALLPSEQHTDVVMNVHHSICDAMAIIYYFRDIMCVISGQNDFQGPKTPPLIDQSNIPVSLEGNFLYRFFMKRINKKWRKEQQELDELPFEKIHPRFWEKHAAEILTSSIDADGVRKIVDYASENGVSVGNVILTAWLAALKAEQPSLDYLNDIVISVDFRERLIETGGDTFCFYASAIRPELEYDSRKTFEDNLREFDKSVRDNLTDEKIFESQKVGALDVGIFDAFHLYKQGLIEVDVVASLADRLKLDRMSKSICYTNLGRVDIPRKYGKYSIEEIYGPFVLSDTMEKYVGIVTIDDRMTMSVIFDSKSVESETVSAVFKRARDVLESEIGV